MRDRQVLFPGATVSSVHGFWMFTHATELCVDEVELTAGRRAVARHGGAEWRPEPPEWLPAGEGGAGNLAGGRDRDRPGYLVADHLGNALALRDGAGAVAATYRADAFGNVVAATGSAAWGAAGYAHTRNVLDAGAGGLHDFHNRWYDPATGRFTQRRTPFQPLREHPYALAESNPATWTDRWGFGPEGETDEGYFSGACSLVEEVARKAWNLPNTVIGLVHGVVGVSIQGVIAPFTEADDTPYISLGHNAIQFHNNALMLQDTAVALGNVISYSFGVTPNDIDRSPYNDKMTIHTGEHEEHHTRQAEVLGPLYLPVYAVGWVIAPWTGGHFMENAADLHAKVGTP